MRFITNKVIGKFISKTYLRGFPRVFTPKFSFSNQESSSENAHVTKNSEKHGFKAETGRLLEIVAKSLYTEKEVFIRELLSNASDALEKQRFKELKGESTHSDPLQISITTDESTREISIVDTGVGMDKEELIGLLGTIAKSGSGQLKKDIKERGEVGNELDSNLIGQFGVGFYSAFVVADSVEVISKKENHPAHIWKSNGEDGFEVSELETSPFERGTQVILRLKPEHKDICRKEEVKKAADRYSGFVSYPLFLNLERINSVSALWSRDPKEVEEVDYRGFWEKISGQTTPYRFKLHFNAEAPFPLKSILFFPSTNPEQFGIGSQKEGLSLYSKKVLVKELCKDLLPNYLRFIKGVVDCEELPLNVSREGQQDQTLFSKIRSILTRRVLRMLADESRKNPEEYKNWHRDFHIFIKEGLYTDKENGEALLALCRFDTSFSQFVSIDGYLEEMKSEQENIYYFLTSSVESAKQSPYMEPFNKAGVPVIFISVNVEEMIFRQLGEYRKHKFVNIENSEADLPDNLKSEEIKNDTGFSSDDLPLFCNWAKTELQPMVTTVIKSKRLSESPAVIISQMSTGMRQMMAFIGQEKMNDMTRNLTLEINSNHPLIVSLNELRKTNPRGAVFNLRQLVDACLLSAGIPFDTRLFLNRVHQYILKDVEGSLNSDKKSAADLTDFPETEVTGNEVLENALNEAIEDQKKSNEDEKKEIKIK